MIFKMGELFCGPGGLALAAKQAEVVHKRRKYVIRHAWANDYDANTCATYAQNICPADRRHVLCSPVQNLVIEKLPPIDALAFGFPCNDYSIVGEQKGLRGEYGPLYTYGERVLNHHRPRWFLAENVSGLQNSNDGQAFAQIIGALREAGPGYNLTVHLYKFEQYGVPQQRHRIIIIGIARPEGLTFRVPAPTTLNNPVTAGEALANIPHHATHSERTRQSPAVVERLRHIPPGENAWYEGIPVNLRLNVKGATMSQIYKRLDPSKPSYTITGSGGGGTHGYHWEEPRALTNRERARLQTFPDSYEFAGSKESVRKQIGMAVPPLGAQVIFEAVLKTFAGVEYDWVPSRWPTTDAEICEETASAADIADPVFPDGTAREESAIVSSQRNVFASV